MSPVWTLFPHVRPWVWVYGAAAFCEASSRPLNRLFLFPPALALGPRGELGRARQGAVSAPTRAALPNRLHFLMGKIKIPEAVVSLFSQVIKTTHEKLTFKKTNEIF